MLNNLITNLAQLDHRPASRYVFATYEWRVKKRKDAWWYCYKKQKRCCWVGSRRAQGGMKQSAQQSGIVCYNRVKKEGYNGDKKQSLAVG